MTDEILKGYNDPLSGERLVGFWELAQDPIPPKGLLRVQTQAGEEGRTGSGEGRVLLAPTCSSAPLSRGDRCSSTRCTSQ